MAKRTGTLEGLLSKLSLGKPRTSGSLTVVPVLGNGRVPVKVLTVDEALANNLIEITETSELGHVPELLVRNDADLPILILDGEEVVGAKQNRILNVTVLIAPKSKTVIPVSCVEQGRWHYRSRQFETGGFMAFPELRVSKLRSVTSSLRECSVPRSDQREIWNTVECTLEGMGVDSATGAMHAAYRAFRESIEELANKLEPLEQQRGHVAFVAGRMVGTDVFHDSALYAGNCRKLIRSYALDVAARQPDGTQTDGTMLRKAALFLENAKAANTEVFDSISLGEDHRVETRHVEGSALEYGGTFLYGVLFPARE